MTAVKLTEAQIEARRANIRSLIESAGSTFIGVEFVKKDNSIRNMNVQTHAGRALLVGENACDSAKQAVETRKANHPNLFNVYDVVAKAWRSINLDTVFGLTVKGVRYDVGPIVG